VGTLTDNYQIIKELGKGGMGTVYLAIDKRLDRKVAIKILQISSSFSLEQKSEIISRFQKEAKAIAKLSHTNIVGIHDIGEDEGKYYMVMEFLEGISIGNRLDNKEIFPIEEALNISLQMCKALSYIHANSVVHRDIKPDNIILTSKGVAKLTDFGIAQVETEKLRLTQDGAILGSIMYISPEQLRNSKDVDNRTDIYSFGVTLYQMLTGQLPFAGETVGEVVTKVLSDEPIMPRQLNPNLPFELEAIILKAINKKRDKRYASMEDMERDILNLISSHAFKKDTINSSILNTNTLNSLKSNTSSNLRTNTISSSARTTQQGLNSITNLKKIQEEKPEKASTTMLIFRIALKLLISLGIMYISFMISKSLIIPSVGNELNATLQNQGAIIQGPYSQFLVEKGAGDKSALFSILITLIYLIFSIFTFPLESKGKYKNFNISMEIVPMIIVLTIVSSIAVLIMPKVDVMKNYKEAYNQAISSKITDFNAILSGKGFFAYSDIDEYKKKYVDLLKSDKKFIVYDEKITQVKDTIFSGDYIKLQYNPKDKKTDRVKDLIDDLMNNIFSFPNPETFLYTSKVSELVSLISSGLISSLPETAKYSIEKDSSDKLNKIIFEWDTNRLVIESNSASLNTETAKYVYPKIDTSKLISIKFQNLTDGEILLLTYSSLDSKDSKKEIIAQNDSIDLDFQKGKQYQVIVMFQDKNALPLANTLAFNSNDSVKIDSIYYETPEYYNITKKDFANNAQEEKLLKIELLENNLLVTKDADITVYKLVKEKLR